MSVAVHALCVCAHVYVSVSSLCPVDKVGAKVVEAACVIELPALKGREKLEGLPLFVLIEKEGE